MKTTRYDERCPHCGEKIADLYDLFVGHDYETDFDIGCTMCGKMIGVNVRQVPEFCLCSETNAEEEQRAMARAKERKFQEDCHEAAILDYIQANG